MRKVLLKAVLFIGCISLALSCTKSQKEDTIVRAPYGVYSEGLIADILPTGWIGEFLSRQNSGMTGHPESMSYPYNSCLWAGDLSRNTSEYGSDWWRYEQTAYYTDGLLRLGYLTGEKNLIEIGEAGIEYTLSHASKNGRLGVHSPDVDDSGNEAVNGETKASVMTWPMSVYFRVLQAYYQVSHDRRIPEALEKNYLIYTPEDLASWRNFISIEGILWTYAITGNPDLLNLAEKTWELGSFEVNQQACLSGEPLDVHGVTFCESIKIPMLLYAYTGNQTYLDAALLAQKTMEEYNMLPDGVPTSAENLCGLDVTHSHETCDITDYTWALGYFLMTTGDGKWADKIERAIFNAGPGAVTKDFKTLQYFSSVNQFIATGNSNNNGFKYGSTWMAYRPTHETECCAGNVHRFMPNYVARMWLDGGKDNLVAAMYGPSEISYGLSDGVDCLVNENTNYPFSDKIDFEFDFIKNGKSTHGKHSMIFSFRIPSWVDGVNVRVNGATTNYRSDDKGFAHIERSFRSGDVVSVTFDVPVEVENAAENQGIYFSKGPVLYAYAIPTKVEEDTTEYANMHGKVPGDPSFKCLSMTPTGKWNYAVSSDIKPEFIASETSGYPFDLQSVPSKLRIPVKQIDWTLKEDRYTPVCPKGPVAPVSDSIEYIDLVPYGSTCLRLTVFPVLAD